MGNIGPWQLAIVALLIILLFGSRKLPEMARGLGQSLKIFKAETKGLAGEDASADQPAIKKDEKAAASEPSASEQTTQQQKNESA